MTEILLPKSEADAVAIVQDLRARKTPVTVAGQGTKASIGRPAQDELTLSSRAMSGVTLYEPAEMMIRALPGTPVAELEATLASKGQRLPFEPMDYRVLLGTTGEPTVGGMVAANISGPRRIMVGACRDSLIGVRIVTGRGEAISSGGRVMKNVTGLDLVKLAAGSWGTLGLFTELTFKVLPVTETSATLMIHGLSPAQAVDAMARALGSPFEVNGAAHLPSSIDRVAKTLLRLEGFAPSVTYRLDALRTLLAGFGSADVVTADASEVLWQNVRDARFLATGDDCVWRVSVAPTKAPLLLEDLGAVPQCWFMDWGGGLLWLATKPQGDAGAKTLRQATQKFKAHATLIRAPQSIRAHVDVFEPPASPVRMLSEGIKDAFDPDRLFNAGRMMAGL
ncbi:FAD-binding protein [Rhizobiales bacterium TNE-4]|nr:FAD-binding protein [Rhizobiales bacterium TNE-4]MBV1828459.1 FAD-binding protein [Rhizobiales bacterium TNE-4]